ncbi:hypothetical protein [Methylomonas rivi]|uniref:Uncharacterized protein n=1 Tax=Methylomonas rivi TaxID=2952226 RepID=A0ABT1U9J5_9GAMM|nr:hypothetical protein [Methylomonas sp. WSC-6]MCQ8130467.1 hypothetical protein [Methylomonas sp. WSC-6]
MVSELITEQLNSMVPDLVVVGALFLVVTIVMRSIKLAAYSAEFDRQYKAAAANAHKSGDKSFFAIDNNALKNEYIANRMGGKKRYVQQKRQQMAFNNARNAVSPKTRNTYSPKKNHPSNNFNKQVKLKYGISQSKIVKFKNSSNTPVYTKEYFQNFEKNFQKNNSQIQSRLSLRTGKFHKY